MDHLCLNSNIHLENIKIQNRSHWANKSKSFLFYLKINRFLDPFNLSTGWIFAYIMIFCAKSIIHVHIRSTTLLFSIFGSFSFVVYPFLWSLDILLLIYTNCYGAVKFYSFFVQNTKFNRHANLSDIFKQYLKQ